MRPFRRRAVLSALAATAIAAMLIVPSATARTDAGATQQATTTITFWQTMNEEETKTLKSIVSSFQKANTTIKVNTVYVPFDQAQAKYATAAQGGKAPDVMRAEIAWIADYAARGFLADLTKNISSADRNDFLGSAFAYGVWQGKSYAVPQVTDAPALLYNKALFRSKGVARAELDGSLEAACKKFGDGKGIFLRGDAYFVQPWIWAYGGGLVNPLKKEILIASKGSINGMTAYKRLFDSSCAFKNEDFANDYNNAQTAFKNGDVAMIENGPWATADVLSGKAFANKANLGIAPLPRGARRPGLAGGRPQLRRLEEVEERGGGVQVDPVPDEGVEPGDLRLEEQPAADAEVGVPERRGEEESDHLGVPQPDARRARPAGAPGGRRDLHRLHARTCRRCCSASRPRPRA